MRAATKVNNDVSQSQEKIHHISTEPCSGMRVMFHSGYHILRATLINVGDSETVSLVSGVQEINGFEE